MDATETTERRIYVACLHCYNSGRLHGHWFELGADEDTISEEMDKLFEPLPTTVVLTGADAIEHARLEGKTLSKYCDPVEEAREGLTPEEAEVICREDAALIYLTTYQTPWLPCGGEELMVHDHEGFDGLGYRLGEVSPWEAVKVSEFFSEFEADDVRFKAAQHALGECGDFDTARSKMERFLGLYPSFEEFVQENEMYSYAVRADAKRYEDHTMIRLDNLTLAGCSLESLIDWGRVVRIAEQDYDTVELGSTGVLIFELDR